MSLPILTPPRAELNFDIVVNPTVPLLRSCTTSSGGPLWSTEDSGHMMWKAYRDLAGALGEMAAGGDADDSVSCSSEGAKGKQQEKVVMLPAATQHKHGRPPPVAGCLCGEVERGRSGQRGPVRYPGYAYGTRRAWPPWGGRRAFGSRPIARWQRCGLAGRPVVA
jgi:hypothetical protein